MKSWNELGKGATMNNDSFIRVKADWVRERITLKRMSIEQARNNEWYNRYVEPFERKRSFWMMYFPWLKMLTPEQIKDRIRQQKWWTPDSLYWRQELTLNRLERLINTLQDDHIYLSSSDAEYL
jgi:hypothetical protein